MLKDQILADLKSAMMAKQQLQLDTLRMLKARIMNEEIAKSKEFSDDELVSIVSSEVKRRNDSIKAYTDGGRPELAEKEQQEIAVLQKYLPEQLSEEKVREIVEQTLAGQTFSPSDFGKAMGMLMPKLKGKASGDVISKILKEKLS
ncbi:MAG: GatB/YqeY domain-containing protein [Candidatus Doudnabacteria bacterium]